MNKPIIHEHSCNSKFPCHRYFTCDRCARIRQSKIARTIHQPASEQPIRTWQVFKIEDDAHIPTITAKLTRAIRAEVAGGMWTIEYGSKGMGLHLNLLTASDVSPAPVDVRGLTYRWQSEIIQTHSGFVAAYITKRSQLPPREIYNGRTVALFGDWRGRETKPLREYLVTVNASMRKIGDIFATAALQEKSLAFALVNAAALIQIVKQTAPEVMTAYEHEQSRKTAHGAINSLNSMLKRARAAKNGGSVDLIAEKGQSLL